MLPKINTVLGTVRDVEKVWMTRHEAAKYLGVSYDWVKRQNLGGGLSYYKVDGVVFIAKRDLDKLITKNKVY